MADPLQDPAAAQEPQGQGQGATATPTAAPATQQAAGTPQGGAGDWDAALRSMPQQIESRGVAAPVDRPWFSFSDFVPWTLAGRAGENVIQDVVSLEDLFKKGPPKPRSHIMGEPESFAGNLATGALEFMTFFVPSRLAIGATVKGLNLAGKLGRAGRALPYLEGLAAGGISDFMVSSQGAALSGFLQTLPSDTARSIGGILGSEGMDDTQLTRRLKGTLEGLFLGSLLDGTVSGLKTAYHAMHGAKALAEPTAEATEGFLRKIMTDSERPLIPENVTKPIEPVGEVRPKETRDLLPEPPPGTVGAEATPPPTGEAAGAPRAGGDPWVTPASALRHFFGPDVLSDMDAEVTRKLETIPFKDIEGGQLGNYNPLTMDDIDRLATGLKKGDPNRRTWRTSRDAAETQSLLFRIADLVAPNDDVIPMAEQFKTEANIMADIIGDKTAGAMASNAIDSLVQSGEAVRGSRPAQQLASLHAYARLLKANMEGHLETANTAFRFSVDNPGSRDALADAVDKLAYQLMLSANGRPMFSEMGRGLGSLNLMSKGPKFSAAEVEGLRTKWLEGHSLLPKETPVLQAAIDRTVPMRSLVNDPEAFTQAMEAMGGEKAVRDLIAKYAEASKASLPSIQGLKTITELAAAPPPKTLAFALELYVNNILSAVSTIINVATQQLTQGIYFQPLRRAAGAKVAQGIATVFGNREAAARFAQVASAAMGTLRHTVNAETMTGLPTLVRQAFETGEGSFMRAPVASQGRLLEHGAVISYEPIRAYIEKNFPKADPDGPFARSVYWLFTEKGIDLGNWIRIPGRTLTATDQATKAIVAKSILAGELESEAAIRFAGDAGAAAKWTTDQFNRAFSDGRLMTAQNVRAAAREKAFTEGQLQGWSDAKIESRARDLARQFADEEPFLSGTIDYAAKQANEAAATIQPAPDTLASKVIEWSNAHLWPRFFLPFMSSSWSNLSVAMRPFNVPGWVEAFQQFRLPPGARNLAGLKSEFAKEILSQDPRRVADAVGRLGFAGTAASIVTAWASIDDKSGLPAITGEGPKSQGAKDLLRAAGWLPYSIRVGDTYVSYARADPVATTIGILADIATFGKYASDDDLPDFQRATGGVLAAMAGNVRNKTYMLGLANMLDLASGQMSIQDWLERTATSMLIPNIVSRTGQSVEAIIRDQDPALREARTMLDQIERKLPFFDQRAPLRRNVMGEPISKEKYVGLDAFSPIAYNKVSDDPIDAEFARVGARFDQPSRKRGAIDLMEILDHEGKTAYDNYQERIGTTKLGNMTLREQLRHVIGQGWYHKLPTDEERRNILRGTIEDHRSMAYWETLKSMPELRAAEASQYASSGNPQ